MKDMYGTLSKLIGRKADAFECYVVRTSTLTIEVKSGQLETTTQARTEGLCLRTIRNRILGFSYTFSLTPASLKTAVGNALGGGRGTDPDDAYGFPEGDTDGLPSLEIFDGSLEGISRRKKFELAAAVEDFAYSFSRKVTKVRKATYAEYTTEIAILNSTGLSHTDKYTIASLGVMAVAEDKGDSQMGWESDFSHAFKGLDSRGIGHTAARKAVMSLGARKIKSLSCPVVLDRETVADLLSILSPSFSLESVIKKKSSLAGKIGHKVFSPAVTIVDDGLNEKGAACFPFDGEGVKKRRIDLVSEGILQGHLSDTLYARKAKTSSTGNSLRTSLKFPPGVGVSNLSIEPGALSREDIIREAWDGLYITELVGVHTADPVSGDFSLGATGSRIERGHITYPVRGVAVSGNLFELFSRVAFVGCDHRFYGPWGAPTVMLERMSVSGR